MDTIIMKLAMLKVTKRKFELIFLITIVCLLVTGQACSEKANNILSAHEVPASFDTMLICRTNESDNSSLSYKWFSDNGTIKGDGKSVRWQAPADPGEYEVGVNVTDGKGIETASSIKMNVVPPSNQLIELNPLISLKVPIWGNDFPLEQRSMFPMAVAEIDCSVPLSMFTRYKYTWSCNGGKISGVGVKDGLAARIGWASPGNPGYYTVMVTISDDWGNQYTNSIYFNVVNPTCCGTGVCEVK